MSSRTRPGGSSLRLLVAALVGVLWCASFAVGPARAFWSATSTNLGSGVAAVGSLDQPAAPTVVATAGTAVVSWTASTRADGVPVTAYTVQRTSAAGVAQTVGGSCAGTVTGTTCTETGVPDGTWRYAVTPVLGSWTGPSSALGGSTVVDATAPTLAVPVAAATSGSAYQSGSTVWFRGAAAGSLTLTSTVTDAGSGPAGATTTALAGTTTGWSHVPGRVSAPAGGPYVSAPFSWAAGTTGTATTTVTGADAAGNLSAPRTVTFADDSLAPVGATLVATTGAVTATSVTLTLGTVTDAGSGVASRTLYERAATLTGNTCGTFTAWSAVQAVTTGTVTRAIGYGTCYDYQYVVVDNLGTSATVSLAAPVKNRSYAALVTGTPGVLDYYRLGESSSSTISDAATAVTTNNGTCSGPSGTAGPVAGRPGAIAGDPDTAFGFDGVDDSCSVARGVATSFSLELWMNATAGKGSGTLWYNGAGLVGADLQGAATDFGVTLMQDGRLCVGSGLLVSQCTAVGTSYLGGWHHVVMVRDTTLGTIVLYVDGVLRATALANALTLDGSANLRLGGLKTGGSFYQGTLDEVAVYSAALPATTVLQHYQSGTG